MTRARASTRAPCRRRLSRGKLQYQYQEWVRRGFGVHADTCRYPGHGPAGYWRQRCHAHVLNAYPLPNDPTQGDGLNRRAIGFRTRCRAVTTHIFRGSTGTLATAKHTLFWRGNLQNDDEPTAPAFPGQPPSTSTLTNSKGFAVGYTIVLSSNLVNNLRYGFTRQGVDTAGTSNQPHVYILGGVPAGSFSAPRR